MNIHKRSVVLIGVGIVVAAATYFFTGEEGKKRREEIRAWVREAKLAVLAKLGKVRSLTGSSYETMIDEVMSRYEGVRDVTPHEVRELKKELKAHWKKIAESSRPEAS